MLFPLKPYRIIFSLVRITLTLTEIAAAGDERYRIC